MSRQSLWAVALLLAGASARAQPAALPEGALWVRTLAPTGLDSAFAAALDSSAGLVVAGRAGLHAAFARLRLDGRVDSTFGTNGVVVVPADPALPSAVRRLAVDADGALVGAGTVGPDVLLVRLRPGGARDASFGSNGVARRTVSGEDRVRALLAVPGGYLVGGSADGLASGGGSPLPGRGAFVARFTHAGAPASWGQGGVVYPDLRGPSEVTALAPGTPDVTVGAVRQLGTEVAAVFFALDASGTEQPFPDGSARAVVALPGGSEGPLGLLGGPSGSFVTVARTGADLGLVSRANGRPATVQPVGADGAPVPHAFAGTRAGLHLAAGEAGGQGFLLAAGRDGSAAAADPVRFEAPVVLRRYALTSGAARFDALAVSSGPAPRRVYVAGTSAGAGNRTAWLVAAFDLSVPVASDEAPRPRAGLSLAPLPARHRVRVRAAPGARLTVVDVHGRTVLTAEAHAPGVGSGEAVLDVSGLAPGLYVVRAEGPGGVAVRVLPVVR